MKKVVMKTETSFVDDGKFVGKDEIDITKLVIEGTLIYSRLSGFGFSKETIRELITLIIEDVAYNGDIKKKKTSNNFGGLRTDVTIEGIDTI